MITSETSPLYVEAKLAEATGFSRDTMKRARLDLLEKKTEWSIIGKQVVLTLPAMARVVTYLSEAAGESPIDAAAKWPGQLEDCRLISGQEKKAAGELVTLTVTRKLVNHRLLTAPDPDPANPEGFVMVRVNNNENFRPQMTLQARLVRPGLYQMEGRCPRFPGRY